ncbi:ketopantoate reductase family protein [Arthrobacter mangrovi]|uniref:2-dehydropantoate 2-reductase n=1 Tax=Arthrobacter mangrovi TaxID=2966350 RepID=A0ABQ5MRJ1_9MICC|nr:2-dehydropantoate 2-reductase [Arthrobacter mangrovi]GLB66578.1 2-dehydropantoate 2-reductase [Arthrobacter mangrovi]
MKTAIVGAGAMGQLFGARLQLAGTDVVFLDTNQATIDVLNARGVTLQTESRTEHTPARAARASELDETFDLFIIFTKGFHTQAAVASIAHLIGAESCGLTLQNGLGNAERLQEYFGPSKTLLGVTDFPADLSAPGMVSSNSRGKVRLGALGNVPRLPNIAQLLDSADLHAAVEQDIRIPVWEKVAFNAALNTLSAVTGLTVGGIGADPHARGLVASVLEETLAVAGRLQIDVSRQRIEAALDNAFAHHTHHKTSMLMDREAGRPTEIDTIGGAVVRLGQDNGVSTPVLATLCELVRTAARPGDNR